MEHTKAADRNSVDMLHGSLWDKILKFALPLALSSILQQLFNAADVAVVGRYSGTNAMAAVGSNGPMINLLVNVFVGLSVGANVVISNYIGKNDKKGIHDAVHTSISVACISGIFLLVLGQCLIHPMLTLMAVPEEVYALAALYLRIYFIGMPFMMLYNFSAAILRSVGDTRRPTISLTIAGILNVFLNLFFVRVCHLSVSGVAIATVISQGVSAGLLLYFLMREEGALQLSFKELCMDKTILKQIAGIGLPAGLQGCVFSFSNVCIQSALNSLGSTVMAGSSAALNLEMFVFYMINSFNQACVTFTGQNYGAGDHKRCVRVIRCCIGLALLFTCGFIVLLEVLGEPLLSIFNPDPAVVEIGMIRVRNVLTFQFINMITEVMSGGMRGLGHSIIPAVTCLIGVCGTRLLWVYAVFPSHRTFSNLTMAYPISWCITTVVILIAYAILKKKVLYRA